MYFFCSFEDLSSLKEGESASVSRSMALSHDRPPLAR